MTRQHGKNCWEIKNCGREPSGSRVHELGVCPATIDECCDGLNNGKRAGRICWAVTGTLCGGTVQGLFAMKIESCIKCEVFKAVSDEEGHDFVLRPEEILPATKRIPILKKKPSR